jgi:hypothetical protein
MRGSAEAWIQPARSFRISNHAGKGLLAMTSAGSRKAKPATFSAPQRLTPAEIESLRANKRELHRKLDEIHARKAAEKATTAKTTTENQAAETAAAE